MAVVVTSLVVQGGAFRSLIRQLGVRDSIRWISSSTGFGLERLGGAFAPDRMVTANPLLVLGYETSGPAWIPHCLSGRAMNWGVQLSLEDWWSEPIYLSTFDSRVTRGELVRTMRDQDGGAHVDPAIASAGYVDMMLFADRDLRARGRPIGGAHRAAMRQIAWEILASVERVAEELDPD